MGAHSTPLTPPWPEDYAKFDLEMGQESTTDALPSHHLDAAMVPGKLLVSTL